MHGGGELCHNTQTAIFQLEGRRLLAIKKNAATLRLNQFNLEALLESPKSLQVNLYKNENTCNDDFFKNCKSISSFLHPVLL